jgi:hypothetical protein
VGRAILPAAALSGGFFLLEITSRLKAGCRQNCPPHKAKYPIMLGVAIDNPNTIDIMSESPRRELVLTISDHLDWTDSKGHQFTLQEKLNGYLRFIESGEVYEHRPKAVGLRIVISVAGQFELDFEGKQFLARAQTIIESAGFGFEYRLFDT